jgi:hypothetical protein
MTGLRSGASSTGNDGTLVALGTRQQRQQAPHWMIPYRYPFDLTTWIVTLASTERIDRAAFGAVAGYATAPSVNGRQRGL